MADYRSMQSAALLGILVWHRSNKMMASRVNVSAPALGTWKERVLSFSGVGTADEYVPFILGFNPEEGTQAGLPLPGGQNFSNDEIMDMGTQLDADAMSGQMLFASPGRGQGGSGGNFMGSSFAQSVLPGWFVWNLDGDNGPFCIWRYISKKALNAVRNRVRTQWFRGTGGRSQAQTRRRS